MSSVRYKARRGGFLFFGRTDRDIKLTHVFSSLLDVSYLLDTGGDEKLDEKINFLGCCLVSATHSISFFRLYAPSSNTAQLRIP